MLRQLLIRLAANGLGLWLAGELVSGISYGDSLVALAVATVIFSLVNAIIRPLAVLLAFPAIILTLGLFTLVINSLMLYLATVLYEPFVVTSFGAAIMGVIIIWIVNYAVNAIVPNK
jgi:putative membrane protein